MQCIELRNHRHFHIKPMVCKTGDGMQVNDAKITIMLIQHVGPVANSPQIVSKS